MLSRVEYETSFITSVPGVPVRLSRHEAHSMSTSMRQQKNLGIVEYTHTGKASKYQILRMCHFHICEL